MKTFKIFLGWFMCLIGVLLMLHFSDINPLWYWKGYVEWFTEIVKLVNPQNGFMFLLLIATIGVVFVVFGNKILKSEGQI